MAKRLTTEDALAALPRLREIASDDELAAQLRPLLRHRSNYVIAKAAALAEARGLAELAPELAESYFYFMTDPVKRDPGCSAKLAIVNALSRFHEPVHDLFLAGIRHRQPEPSFGPPIDTAATLRALCGRALIAFGHPDAFRWHAVLLADPEPMTRTMAVETLAGVPDERAELLLRSKIARESDRARDPERGVEFDAFDALMKIAPENSFNFVTRYLDDADADRVRAAALAIGASHHEDVFATLVKYWRRGGGDVQPLLALPISIVRSEESFRFLLDQLSSAGEPVAAAIIEALALFREDPERKALVLSTVETRKSRALRQAFTRHFEHVEKNSEPA